MLLVDSDVDALEPWSGRSVEMTRSVEPPPPPPAAPPLVAHADSDNAATAPSTTTRVMNRVCKTPPTKCMRSGAPCADRPDGPRGQLNRLCPELARANSSVRPVGV